MFIIKYKNRIITVVIIVAVLAAAWFFGGNNNRGDDAQSATAALQATKAGSQEPESESITGDSSLDGAPVQSSATVNNTAVTSAASHGLAAPLQNSDTAHNETGNQVLPENPEPGYIGGGDAYSDAEEPAGTHIPDGISATDVTPVPGSASSGETTSGETTSAETTSGGTTSGETTSGETPIDKPPSEETAQTATVLEATRENEKGSYHTDHAPEGLPSPVEPQNADLRDGEFTVTLVVRCDTILDNMNLLNKEKHELIPDDGVLFPAVIVTAYEGESVFNVLQREMRRAGMHMAFRSTPLYNAVYIEAINNLYEFDAGELSGWMYCVTRRDDDAAGGIGSPDDTARRWYPNYGCSRFRLQPGDVIEWNYTCDLGRDLGENAWLATGSQRDN